MLKVDLIDADQAFLSLRGEWGDLLEKSHNPNAFISFEWLWPWWKSFGEGRLALFTVRESNNLIGIIPLRIKKISIKGVPATVLESMTNYHSPRFDFIIKKEMVNEVIVAFIDYVNEEVAWDYFHLSYVPQNSVVTRNLEKLTDKIKVRRVYHVASPYMKINSDWESFYKGRSKSFRKNVDYAERKLKQAGRFVLREIKQKDSLLHQLEKAFDIEARSWKGGKGSAIACSEQEKSFYYEVAELWAGLDRFCLYFLNVEGEDIAFDYCLQYSDTMNLVKIGYDPNKFAKYSPGVVIRKKVLEEIFTNNHIRKYDMLGTSSQWKMKWTNDVTILEHVFIYRKSFFSRLLYLIQFEVPDLIKKYKTINKLRSIFSKD